MLPSSSFHLVAATPLLPGLGGLKQPTGGCLHGGAYSGGIDMDETAVFDNQLALDDDCPDICATRSMNEVRHNLFRQCRLQVESAQIDQN